MFDILAITGPIYLSIGLGYASVRYGWFRPEDTRALAKFVLNFALPALLFYALAQRRLDEVLHWSYLAAFAAGSLLLMLLVLLWARHRQGKSRSASAYFAMGMTCSNSGYMGYPILVLALGPVAAVVLALNMLVENLLKLPLLLAYAETDPSQDGQRRTVGALLRQTAVRLLSNPMILGMLAGVAVAISGWTLPAVLAHTVKLFAQASAPLALFVIGGSLVGLHIKGMRGEMTQIVLGKLLLHPLFVWFAVCLLPWLGAPALDAHMRAAVVLSAAMPMLGIYPLLAQRHGRGDVAAAALLATTVASFFSISALLWWMRQSPAWLG